MARGIADTSLAQVRRLDRFPNVPFDLPQTRRRRKDRFACSALTVPADAVAGTACRRTMNLRGRRCMSGSRNRWLMRFAVIAIVGVGMLVWSLRQHGPD